MFQVLDLHERCVSVALAASVLHIGGSEAVMLWTPFLNVIFDHKILHLP